MMIEVLFVLIVTAMAASLLGVFLVLRGMAMVTDAISHTILLGIVLAFFVTNDIRSPWLIIAASLVGLATVYIIELVSKTELIRQDAAIGFVFTALFAIAVILVSKFAGNVHLDMDVVLMGEVIFAPFNRIDILGVSIPNALWQLSIILLINIAFVTLFYKELKVTSFDPKFAYIAGFSVALIHYGLMTLVSVTAVAAFDAVGSILVINFFVAPALTAYLLVRRLGAMIGLALAFAVLNSVAGYFISFHFDLSVAGTTAFVALITFMIVFLFNSKGFIIRRIQKQHQKKTFSRAMIMMLMNEASHESLSQKEIMSHFNLSEAQFNRHISYLIANEYMEKDEEKYRLTRRGEEFTHYTRLKYELPA
ncbi:metal ABC transporter permease [Salinicoccus sp. ID82-1]|uniref:metal ABC transporter permease n=1 Tax=Salinicoccus sp. ID82-1 TaxID=2820269 RepID=UPI001F01EBDA|nr:metal ABC transporter permease [Salinicoccus sp. ID82-1]